MKKVTVEIPKGTRLELQNGMYVIVKDRPGNVRDRIKTFEDAYEELRERDDMDYLIREYDNKWTDSEDLLAYLKLRIIVAALNEGWEPEFKKGEYRYFVWIDYENDAGLTLKGVYGGLSSTSKFNSSRLALKSRNLAIYAGEQFKDLWIDYLIK